MEKEGRNFSWVSPLLEIRKTEKCGKGIFAKRDIKKRDTLAVFGGYIMTLAEEARLDAAIKDYAHQIDDNFVIGIKNKKDIRAADFFNHSCEPNAGFYGQIFLVAMRDIKKGEETTFDYAMVLGGDEPYKLDCLCQKITCRKKITNNDWKNIELQKKYRGFFQWYLQEKIDKLK